MGTQHPLAGVIGTWDVSRAMGEADEVFRGLCCLAFAAPLLCDLGQVPFPFLDLSSAPGKPRGLTNDHRVLPALAS